MEGEVKSGGHCGNEVTVCRGGDGHKSLEVGGEEQGAALLDLQSGTGENRTARSMAEAPHPSVCTQACVTVWPHDVT